MAGSNSVEGGAFRLQVDSPWQPNLPEARKADFKPENRVVANVRYCQIVEAQCKADERGIRKRLPTIPGLVKSKLSDEDYFKTLKATLNDTDNSAAEVEVPTALTPSDPALRQQIDELRLQLHWANAEIAEAKAEAAEQKKIKTLERFKEDNLSVAAESDLMDFQFDGTADEKDDQSKEVAILRAASDFNMWKKRKARDVWNEIVATKQKLDDLAEEYEDLAVEDDADDDDEDI
ncbi:hypothetical protein KC340_g16291 [Hortaea werneckii]|nr:hypothetical protein KC342_g16690 [Hortaea werneckii]KAI7079001.1 hypothetical protein KC339_g13596 [Hortaea werneckii]KAI7211232.1 hypothetical protein KC365_g15031 [Hortaea werneckii]KAI7294075.1 hypothetical protein KC340_g16291 [Hortaea werneckii]KAI7379664.1 hypothetical protein KC328_g13200 [Hortaea werneckii]